MRILSIVTLITPNGEYGGPVRVALNQARALRSRGHDVVVIAAARGFGSDLPELVDSVPVKLFAARTVLPGIGFAGLCSPSLQSWVSKNGASFDVAHIHAARDFVTLPAANWFRRNGIPYVLQPHGMIDRSAHFLAIPLDRTLTRPVLRTASAVFYLTPRERNDLREVGGSLVMLTELSNGVPEPTPRVELTPDPSPDGAAAQTEVLFLARLAPRKRPQLFVDMATGLSDKYPNAKFSLVGPDEGEGAAVRDRIAHGGSESAICWEGPLATDRTLERMQRASIYVLPSVDEPYPMSVLEAMSVGLPVVVTDSCGLAPAIVELGCGIVVDDSIESLVAAVDLLLSDPVASAQMGRAGAAAIADRFGMPAIADVLEQVYRRA